LQHEQADVRLAALQALHKQARSDDSELFVPLLSDPSWWVRQVAADSLATMPGASPAALQQLLEQVKDRYGKDALRRAIAEVRR
jgi:HEAT repeat protein